MPLKHSVIILGGGIVGLATAWQLKQRFPQRSILLLEKEADLGSHQTGHNSGVIHSGIYYQPGSFKAQFCQAGARATVQWCEARGVPYRTTGKLIVAVTNDEVKRLKQLYMRSEEHGIAVKWLQASEIRELEPNIVGLAAIQVFSTGIVDYVSLTKSFAEQFVELGGEIVCGAKVNALEEVDNQVYVNTDSERFTCDYLIACCGLQSDRIAALMGLDTGCRIVPIRGEYYRLANTVASWVTHPIYPVPKPDVPFLGVHITPMIDGSFTVGPNAVLAFRREGYGRFEFSFQDCVDTFGYPGVWKMLGHHWRYAIAEFRDSLLKSAYLKQIQRYCPSVQLHHLQAYPSGVRAQAVTRDGALLHDFHFAESPRSLHVCNAPSPAATSAIPIGAHLCDKMASKWQ